MRGDAKNEHGPQPVPASNEHELGAGIASHQSDEFET
jgi:hypothetical protein